MKSARTMEFRDNPLLCCGRTDKLLTLAVVFSFWNQFPMLGTEHDFFGQLNRHFEKRLCKIF